MFCAYIEKKVHVFDNLIVNNRERFTASKHKRKSNIRAVNTTEVENNSCYEKYSFSRSILERNAIIFSEFKKSSILF